MVLLNNLLTVSEPPETGPAGVIKKSAGRPRLAMHTTYLGRLYNPHLSQSFLHRTVEDHPRQGGAQLGLLPRTV